MSTRDSPGGKGGRCVRLTTYHPCSAERQEIRGLNLPGPPWAISTACCGRDLYLYLLLYMKTYVHIWSYLTQFFLEWEIFHTEFVEKIKTHILCSIFFFKNLAVYEIIWKNMVQAGSPQMTIWRMRIACWIPKAPDCNSEYVIFIDFPLRQWLYERASM